MENEAPQDKLSFREFIVLHSNLEWIDREISADGNIKDNTLFEETAERLFDKGFGRPGEDLIEFRSELLKVNDAIAKDQLQTMMENTDLDMESAYEDFLDLFYP